MCVQNPFPKPCWTMSFVRDPQKKSAVQPIIFKWMVGSEWLENELNKHIVPTWWWNPTNHQARKVWRFRVCPRSHSLHWIHCACGVSAIASAHLASKIAACLVECKAKHNVPKTFTLHCKNHMKALVWAGFWNKRSLVEQMVCGRGRWRFIGSTQIRKKKFLARSAVARTPFWAFQSLSPPGNITKCIYERSSLTTAWRYSSGPTLPFYFEAEEGSSGKEPRDSLPIMHIVEERASASPGPAAHWMRRCCLSDPSGLKHKLFWRFESSLVRSASPINKVLNIYAVPVHQPLRFWRRGSSSKESTGKNGCIDARLDFSSSFVWAIVCNVDSACRSFASACRKTTIFFQNRGPKCLLLDAPCFTNSELTFKMMGLEEDPTVWFHHLNPPSWAADKT